MSTTADTKLIRTLLRECQGVVLSTIPGQIRSESLTKFSLESFERIRTQLVEELDHRVRTKTKESDGVRVVTRDAVIGDSFKGALYFVRFSVEGGEPILFELNPYRRVLSTSDRLRIRQEVVS